MIPLDEFYSRSARERHDLIEKGHVVVDSKLATDVPSRSRNDIYVFERPVTEQVVEMLQKGQYKTREIAPELPLDREALDDILADLRYDRLTTLSDYDGVVRATGTDGPANVYTVDPLPFQARTIDPTLSSHLLAATEVFPDGLPPSKTVSSKLGYREYASRVENYWDLPESELKSEVDTDTPFVRSALGPLPLPSEFPDVEIVRNRVLDTEDAYVHKQYSPGKVHHGISLRKTRVRRNPSLPAFQEFASYLADVYQFARLKNDKQLRDLATRGAELYFRCLYGNYRADDSSEWQPFEVKSTNGALSDVDRKILDVFELQPTKNSELAEKWQFEESNRVSRYIRNEFSRFATRNKDQFICATESARRQVERMISEEQIETTKAPPNIPTPVKTPIQKSSFGSSTNNEQTKFPTSSDSSQGGSGSGVSWVRDNDSS
ncbi:DUF5797 family protein [Halalkalicoccus salilacus]|uniref:DUF5797 family protein n=1 Tax=Halalkalicoccus salilacus TaxID=3117459 RepID=UPI00300F3CC7